PWPTTDHPRTAAISSFGISGTNAHLILQQPPNNPHKTTTPRNNPVVPWIISAKNDEALRTQARNLAKHTRTNPTTRPVDIAHALATTRAHFPHRAAVIATTAKEFITALEDLAAGRPNPAVLDHILDTHPSPTGSPTTGGTVFVFPGQGGQWPGMGRRLYAASPVFREHLDACAEALTPHTDWSLLDVLHQRDHAPSLDRVDVVQPALFAIMVALARLWQHHGIHPDAVIGHSQGEIAAAHIAGALSLEDAARVVTLRSQALTELAGHGAMASISLPATDVEDLLTQEVSIAAINSPTTTIVSGTPTAIDNLLAHLETRQIRARKINVDYASHCAHVE
ncbi:acyltransferase domain-containing protein, partial [Nonomuraea sp. NPDC050643]|uniref:acyltransferase domain-containing protein n=1 Tax=Nonomuraea sp. NPDC050643 TaxID=3155660 RepID=UPI0033E2009D